MTLRWIGLAVAAAALILAGCAAPGPATDPAGRRLTVMAAFYPLQFAAEQVGGDEVAVQSLTPSGAEPHDVELSPQQVAAISEADLILYIKGFQPAVDQAVEQEAPGRALDVSQGVPLLASDSREHAGTDPHIWLDPANMVTIAATIEQRLASLHPDAAAGLAARTRALDAQLASLDHAWAQGTRQCANRFLVVSHEAFAYLAKAYHFEQVGVSGLSPEAEPSPGQVADVADFVRQHDITTVYYETLVDPKVARTVAAETGASTAVLDPLEGLPPGSTGDYLTVMRENLRNVEEGQPCP